MSERFARRAIGAILILCSGLAVSPSWAEDAAVAAPVPAATSTVSPDQSIQQPTDQMRALIKQNSAAYKADKPKFYAAVDSILVPHFDIPTISREVLGRYWKTATADQRQRFGDAFKSMLVRSYADQLLEYNDTVTVSFQPAKVAPGDTDTSVTVLLNRPNAKPITVGFGVHLVSGQWQITDIVVEGLSLVLNFRTQVGAQVKQTGIDDVIAKMQNGQMAQPPTPQKG